MSRLAMDEQAPNAARLLADNMGSKRDNLATRQNFRDQAQTWHASFNSTIGIK